MPQDGCATHKAHSPVAVLCPFHFKFAVCAFKLRLQTVGPTVTTPTQTLSVNYLCLV